MSQEADQPCIAIKSSYFVVNDSFLNLEALGIDCVIVSLPLSLLCCFETSLSITSTFNVQRHVQLQRILFTMTYPITCRFIKA